MASSYFRQNAPVDDVVSSLSDEDVALLQEFLGQSAPQDAPEFQLGSDNTDYYGTVTDRGAIVDGIGDYVLRGLLQQADDQGINRYLVTSFWAQNWTPEGALGYIDTVVGQSQGLYGTIMDTLSGLGMGINMPDLDVEGAVNNWYGNSLQGITALADQVWRWYGSKAPFDIGDPPSLGSSGGGGGGGGGGRRLPTAEEIRQQFDLEELSQAATQIWQSILLEEPQSARGMAEAYVNAIVASSGQQKVDFTAFIRKQAMETGRFASIYRNKPESVSPEQYIAPYLNTAMQVLSPNNADEAAIGGAQFGASSQAFSARLRRSDEVTGSAPFMQELESRFSTLNSLFKNS